ncbi:MAG TPA: cbb3-type cytochrome c oxidase subunit I [Candidatus Limnocylindria bacterium]
MAVNPKKLRPYDEPPKVRRPLVPDTPDSAATAFLVVSVLWLAAATGIGVLWVATLLFPGQVALNLELQLPIIGTLGIDVSRPTVESGFMNALVFGWLSNAAFAAICFVTPRLTGERLRDDRMGFGAMGLWNIGVAAGLAGVYIPIIAGSGPLGEFPLPAKGLMLLGAVTVLGAMGRTLMAGERRLPYVSLLFFALGLLALLGLLTISAAAQFFALDETPMALVNAFVARGIVTYWVLGAALGALFYVVPRATGSPLASGGMALLAWLLWAAFAGLSAVGALVDPSVPFVITSLGSVGTILLVAPVFLAVATLALTIHGRWSLTLGTGTLAFALVAMAFLLSTALLEAIGALRSVQGLVRDTEWEMGVWLLGLLGSATFAFFAILDHAAPRVLRRDWGGSIAVDTQLWSTLAGVVLCCFALIGAGIAHGSLRAGGAPAEEVQATLSWFLMVAGAGLGLVALGGLAALVALFVMYTTARRAEYVPNPEASAGELPAGAQTAH